MADQNRRLVLAERPSGMVDEGTVRVEVEDLPECGPGEAIARVRYLSIDPTIRTWMDDAPGYLPPIGVGDVVRGAGVAEVVQSNCASYEPGQLLFGLTGWQDYVIADERERALTPLPAGVPPTTALGLFGITGMTAYFGLLDVGAMGEGDVVVVSGAAGATGSTVGQIARIKGAGQVVGIAGGPEKCAFIVDELGFDAAIDYKAGDVAARLHELCPQGIDLYFDNVGGEHLQAAIGVLNPHGRVALCGSISGYNATERPPGPNNLGLAVGKRLTLRGFIVFDHYDLAAEFSQTVGDWLRAGQLHVRETFADGLDNAVSAFIGLLRGENTGKMIIRLAGE